MTNIVQELQFLATQAGLRGDFGLGSPNEMPPLLALGRYAWEIANPFTRRHGYAPSNGMRETRKAIADWHREKYGLDLHLEKYITITEGSRSGCIFALQGRRGKVALKKTYYPGHLDAIEEAHCERLFLESDSFEEFVGDLETKLQSGILPAAVIVSSVDNPTGDVCSYECYERLVWLARKHGFLLISDEAYRDLEYEGRATSVCQIPGSLDVAICLESASKAQSFAGGKIGVVIANPREVSAIAVRKKIFSEGGNIPAQLAYATALSQCREYPAAIASRYRRRAELTVGLLKEAGITDIKANAMFVWFRVPGNCSAFARGIACRGFLVRPGCLFGKNGWIRWCLRESDAKTREACAKVAEILQVLQPAESRPAMT